MHFARTTDGKRHSVLISVTEHIDWYAKTFLELLSTDWAGVECPDFFSPPDDDEKQELFSRCLASCEDYFGSGSREYRLLERGIVLHHGKMPPVMSRLLIELVQSQVINIVIATSTLSEGVNLPFETVLVPSLLRGRQQPINPKEIINVAGRAGRPGISTEGKTLVLLATNPQSRVQRISRRTYDSIIHSMVEDSPHEVESPTSPLRALMEYIKNHWSIVSGSDNINQFIEWLETTAYSSLEGTNRNLMISLDTLDHQLLTGIEEFEVVSPSLEVEEFLQSLWQNTLARHDRDSLGEEAAREMFSKRGMALTNSIYPRREYRRALYTTGLPPRDGNVLIARLSELKSIFQEAVDYATWNSQERINHFIQLIESISQIDSFGIENMTSRVHWDDVFEWWMAPEDAEHTPSPIGVSRWYKFASKHFLYRLNWAIGSIIGSILERDGGEGQLLTRWTRCELPWSVIWYKDMISWGVLDPIASCALSKKEASTRPIALEIAQQYLETIDVMNDTALEPLRVTQWVRDRQVLQSPMENQVRQFPQREITVNLAEDFSDHLETQFRVLPAISNERIDWFDPAGYLLASSNVPENIHIFDLSKLDFFLNPNSRTIVWEYYV